VTGALGDIIAGTPALVKILGAFASILLAVRLKLHLGLAMLVGTAVLGLWCALPAEAFFGSILHSATDPSTWGLVAIVTLIVVFGKALSLSGRLDRLVAGVVRRAGSRRRAAAILPAIFGLLPMPGGAYLSAPMVGCAAGPEGISPQRMTVINYWFRHMWEYWWPLYPGVILTITILEKARPAGIDLGWFILFECPLTFAVFFAGRFFLLGRRYDREAGLFPCRCHEEEKAGDGECSLLRAFSPVLVVIVLTLAWSGLTIFAGPSLPAIPKSLPLSLFVLVGTVQVFLRDRLGTKGLRAVLKQRKILDMGAIIMTVMLFRGMIEASGAVDEMGHELERWGIPVLPLTAILPFVAGLVTGIAVGFVGASFAVVAGLMPESDNHMLLASYYVLAFGAGYVGMMLSPVHFCLILSKQYFGSSWRKIYRLLLPPALLLLACVAALALLYRWSA